MENLYEAAFRKTKTRNESEISHVIRGRGKQFQTDGTKYLAYLDLVE